MFEIGIVPVYIFDGPAPAMKVRELKKRLEKRELADKQLTEAIKMEDKLMIEKFSKRNLKVEKSNVNDCNKLLKLMGVHMSQQIAKQRRTSHFCVKEELLRE